jgi:hypothetical protein
MAVARVPHFALIPPHVVRMEPGLAEVKVPEWFFVHNHLHTVHAQARLDPPDFLHTTEGVEVVVPVRVTDRSATEVVHADITTWITPAA